MSRYDRYNDYVFPAYVSVAEKKARAEKQLKNLQSKNKTNQLSPVVIKGRNISSSWWGKAWCQNLESYADYSNRIDRGKSYVRNGMVIDLKIFKGGIEALVAGSSPKPYKCLINIAPLVPKAWENIKEHLTSKFDSLQTLLSGNFPEPLKHVFSFKDHGFFPTPKEIKMDCSCPDWASLCKHLAAVLYGVGAKLDKNPELIFTLRGVDVSELITETIQAHKGSLLEKAKEAKKRKTIINITDNELGAMFDIDFKT